MSRLLRVELDRFASRTLIRLGVAAILVVCALAVVSAWDAASPPSQAELDQAQVYYQQALDDWEDNGEQYVADCREQEAADRETAEDPAKVDYGCDTMVAPELANWLTATPSFARDTAVLLSSLSILFVLAPVLLAGSFVSAEFSTGAIGNWLTFAPRRVQVYLSKVLAAGIATIPVAAVGVALVVGGSWAAYRYHDTVNAGLSTDTGSPLEVALRIVALAPVVAMVGAALGFLVRHTAAVLGVLLAWLVLVEATLVSWLPGLSRWSLSTNVSAWVRGGGEYFVNQCTTTEAGQSCTSMAHQVSQTSAGLYLAAGAVLITAVALLVFRRRDVG